jgi:hypothetical protein
MNLRLAFLPLALFLAALAACYTGSAVDTNRPPATDTDGTNPSPDGINPDGDEDGGPRKPPVKPMGLPCDVAEVITSSCGECHGSSPSGGATNRLLTYEDFAATIEGDEGTSMAEASLLRMKSTKRPMPPTGKLTPEKIAAFEKWITNGLPRGSCGEQTSEDGGPTQLPDSGGIKDAGPDASSVCSSGTFSPQSTGASALMKPGRACIKCHSATGGPSFELAGTVYEELHEPNDCHGAANVKVLIIDATGATHTMTTNAAGNFTRLTTIARPYRAMIIKGNTVREMKTPQTDGDCNGCHTEWGNRSPGRIMVP